MRWIRHFVREMWRKLSQSPDLEIGVSTDARACQVAEAKDRARVWFRDA